jgi:hypothetical protein
VTPSRARTVPKSRVMFLSWRRAAKTFAGRPAAGRRSGVPSALRESLPVAKPHAVQRF